MSGILEELGLEGLEGRRIVLGRRVDLGLGQFGGVGIHCGMVGFTGDLDSFMGSEACQPLGASPCLLGNLSRRV